MTDQKDLPFAQRYGFEDIPSQLRLNELSKTARTRLWHVTLKSIEPSLSHSRKTIYSAWSEIFRDWSVDRHNVPSHEFRPDWHVLDSILRPLFDKGECYKVLDFLEYVFRHPKAPKGLANEVKGVLAASNAAYTVTNGELIVPIVLEEVGNSINRAMIDLKPEEFGGARRHLRAATEYLGNGKYSDSVRESIHSIEGLVRVITKNDSATLVDGLNELSKANRIHPTLRAAFIKLYSYASDEKGVRHALYADEEANVDQTDAIFALGSCAAFASYLIERIHQDDAGKAT